MAGFEGTWNIEETTLVGMRITEGPPAKIVIAKIEDSRYRVTIVFAANNPDRHWVFDKAPEADGKTFSHTENLSKSKYVVRLVFDSATNPQVIIEGQPEERSRIERWSLLHPVMQPEDMGTITGMKGRSDAFSVT